MRLKILIVAAALAVGGSAIAQPGPGGGGPSPEMRAAREAMMKACDADLKSLCDGKQGREQMMCLRENNEKLSAGCKDAMSKMPRRGPPGGGPPPGAN